MKKVLTLIVLLCVMCMGAWAHGTYGAPFDVATLGINESVVCYVHAGGNANGWLNTTNNNSAQNVDELSPEFLYTVTKTGENKYQVKLKNTYWVCFKSTDSKGGWANPDENNKTNNLWDIDLTLEKVNNASNTLDDGVNSFIIKSSTGLHNGYNNNRFSATQSDGPVPVQFYKVATRPSYVSAQTAKTDESDSEHPKGLVDNGGTSTKWGEAFTNNSTRPSIVVSTSGQTVLKKYHLFNGNDTNSYSGRRWKSWILEGSNDQTNWENISTVTNAQMNTINFGANSYDLSKNISAYTYYRFTITENEGADMIQMSDLLFEVEENVGPEPEPSLHNVTYHVMYNGKELYTENINEAVGEAPTFDANKTKEIPSYVSYTLPISVIEANTTEVYVETTTSLPFEKSASRSTLIFVNTIDKLAVYADRNTLDRKIKTDNHLETDKEGGRDGSDYYIWKINGDWYNGYTLNYQSKEIKYLEFVSNSINTNNSGEGDTKRFDIIPSNSTDYCYLKAHSGTYIKGNGSSLVGNSSLDENDPNYRFLFVNYETYSRLDRLFLILPYRIYWDGLNHVGYPKFDMVSYIEGEGAKGNTPDDNFSTMSDYMNFMLGMSPQEYFKGLNYVEAASRLTNVYMPEYGEAYRIGFLNADGKLQYVTTNGTTDPVNYLIDFVGDNEGSEQLEAARAAAHTFIIGKSKEFNKSIGGSTIGNILVDSNNGEFFTANNDKEYYGNGGCGFALVKPSTHLGQSNFAKYNFEQKLGTFALVMAESAEGDNDSYYVVGLNSEGEIVKANWDEESADIITAVILEPVEYTINKPALRAPGIVDGNTYTSIYLPYASTPDDPNVKAYRATISSRNSMTLTEMENNEIPKNTGAILIGKEAKNCVLVPSSGDPEQFNEEENVLRGVFETTYKADLQDSDEKIYVLNGGGQIGFYPLADGKKINDHRCYFKFPSSAQVKAFSFDFLDEQTTSVSEINTIVPNRTIFDLQGRKLLKVQKGLNIVDGIKVLR